MHVLNMNVLVVFVLAGYGKTHRKHGYWIVVLFLGLMFILLRPVSSGI